MKPCTGCGQESHGLYSYAYAGDTPEKKQWLCPLCWRLEESVEQGEHEASRLARESREISEHLIRMRHHQRQKKEASMKEARAVFEQVERELERALPRVDELLAAAVDVQRYLDGLPMSINEVVEDLRDVQAVLSEVRQKLQLRNE
jgi:chromosome segregation ATPase